MTFRLSFTLSCTLLALIATSPLAHSSSLYQDGQSGRAAGFGGIDTVAGRTPLDAFASNPATLSEVDKAAFEAGLTVGFVNGTFRDRDGKGGELDDFGIVPKGAVAARLGPIHFGLGILTDVASRADWHYFDTPGGATGITSYGRRAHKSELLLLRTALGASVDISSTLSVGFSAGLLYNRNRLESPYIFQSQPVLRGAKTLLDLETEGWGANFQAGILWKPIPTLQFGVSYSTESKVRSYGRAYADTSEQLQDIGLGAARHDATYDARVNNVFPQKASAGVAWQATRRLLIAGQVDWTNWADSFDKLEVRLRNGNNADLNGLVGSDRLDDDIPLNWEDQWTFRAGAEYLINDTWRIRAGYAYAENPIPPGTLTPLTAAITEHTLTAGVGYERGPLTVDLAWRWDLPASEDIGTSALAGGEYSGSSTEVELHWIVLSVNWAL